MKIKKFLLLIMVNFASERKENDAESLILVKIEEDEYTKRHKTSQYIGVYYNKESKWGACRWSKYDNKTVNNGTYKDEETAAHASDTLARKLMKNGEKGHKFNFPDKDTEVNAEKKSSEYIGVSYHESKAKWVVQRWDKNEKKHVSNGVYKYEETAAHASDTLARKLMENGEQNLKLNFPNEDTEVIADKKTSEYVGVSYCETKAKWRAYRRSKIEKRMISNGSYKDEEQAAHASDTLARKLMENGEQNLKLNFPDEHIEVHPEKNNSSNYIGVSYDEKYTKWRVKRHSKLEKNMVYNGSYKDEETAAHASDTLAKKLMENGEQGHKLNFPDDDTKCQTNKRKRSDHEDLGISQNK